MHKCSEIKLLPLLASTIIRMSKFTKIAPGVLELIELLSFFAIFGIFLLIGLQISRYSCGLK